MNFSSHCPGRIKEERLRLGLSQAQVAEKTGVSREMWGRYERGDAVPGGEVLFSFALIGGDVQYILTGRSSMMIPALKSRSLAVTEIFELLSISDQLLVERILSALKLTDCS